MSPYLWTAGKEQYVTLLHRARRSVQRLGIDITRHPADSSGRRLVQLLRKFDISVVLDVGAHCGGYATMLRHGGYRGRIVSFEPLDGPGTELRRRASSDPSWTVLPFALGDRSGTTVMHVAGNSGASSSVLPMLERHSRAAPYAAYTGEQTAEVRRLDELWEQLVAPGERVFLKMDVQGYEGHVLRGAGKRTAECVGVQTETSLVPLYEGGLLFNEALALLQTELGLTLMSVVPGFADPESGQMLQCDVVLFSERQAAHA